MKKDAMLTHLWDVVEYLKTERNRNLYLAAALEDGDPALIAAILEDIARAKRTAVTQPTEFD